MNLLKLIWNMVVWAFLPLILALVSLPLLVIAVPLKYAAERISKDSLVSRLLEAFTGTWVGCVFMALQNPVAFWATYKNPTGTRPWY